MFLPVPDRRRLRVALATLGMAGCAAAASTAQSTAGPRFCVADTITRVALFDPFVKWYHLTSAGFNEYGDESTHRVRANLAMHIARQLDRRSLQTLQVDRAATDTLLDAPLLSLYRCVEQTLRACVFGEAPFALRVRDFSYGVGPIDSLCRRLDVQAIMIVEGYDEDKTEARRRLARRAAIGSVASLSLGILTGIGGAVVTLPEDRLALTASLIDASGTIIWYGYYHRQKALSLISDLDASTAVQGLFSTFRRAPCGSGE